MIVKYLGYAVLIAAFALVTFFGVGPILFADGSMAERLVTSVVVLICYAVIIMLFRYWRKKHNNM